jgi:hypothetical protein
MRLEPFAHGAIGVVLGRQTYHIAMYFQHKALKEEFVMP